MRFHGLVALGATLLFFAAAPSHAGPGMVAPPPAVIGATVSGFSPSSGRAGTQVTITGTGFSAAARVLVDGKAAKAPTITATSIGFAVPARTSPGAITIRQPGMKDIAVGRFAVLPDARISGMEPASGPVGTQVEIRGSGFLPGDQAQLAGKPIVPTSVAADRLVVVIPAGAESGYVTVGAARSRQRFMVVVPPPSIGSFAPGNGPPGTKVTIQGASFTRDERAYLGRTPLEMGARTDTSLEVTVPLHAKKSEPLTVKGPRGASTSTQAFGIILPPVVDRFEPAAGAPGTRVDLHGQHFLPGDQVQFNGTGLRIVDYEEQQLTVELDRDAQSGTFVIFRHGEKVASAVRPFEVLRQPTITGFSPRTGPVGTHVTLTGTYFAPETKVRYGKQALRILGRTGTVALEVEIPRGDVGQAFTVETHGGLAVTPTTFEVFTYSTVRRITPGAGRQGARVTVSGANFGPTDRFFLGDIELGVVERRADACVVQIAVGAQSGKIAWESHGKRQASRFDFTLMLPPVLTSFAPTSGPAGGRVTLTGTDFTDKVGVRFGQLPCKVVRRKLPTEIVVEIPRAAAGTDYLWIENDGKRFKSAASFQVVVPPSLTSFSPVAGSDATEVTLRGANFTETSAVLFDATPAKVVSRQLPGVLVVALPPLPPGVYAVSISDGSFKVRASATFKVARVPRVTSIAPLTGAAGTEVTLLGENFSAPAMVWFGSAECKVVRREGNRKLVVTIPPGVTGKEYFTVRDGGKQATSTQVFEAR